MAEKMVSLNASRTMMERVRLFVESLVAETAKLIPTKTSELTNDARFVSETDSVSEAEIDAAILDVFEPSFLWTLTVDYACYIRFYDDDGHDVYIWQALGADVVSIDNSAPSAPTKEGQAFTYALDTGTLSFTPAYIEVEGVGTASKDVSYAYFECSRSDFLSQPSPGSLYANITNPNGDVTVDITTDDVHSG